MRWFRLTVAYDGSAYAGWQVQHNRRTIQGEIEAALQRISGQSIRVVSSGRTDAGVHAWGQVVGFHADVKLPLDRLRDALNAWLPPDILVRDVRQTVPGFDPIRDAIAKRYRYLVCDQRLPDVFCGRYAWHCRDRLDEQAMQQAARSLVGRHDFASFENAGSARASTVRTIRDLSIERQGSDPLGPLHPRRLVFEVEADGFLYNMARNLVGTLVQIGRGRQGVPWIDEVLQARDRRVAGPTAPPQGLFLVQVHYDPSIDSPASMANQTDGSGPCESLM